MRPEEILEKISGKTREWNLKFHLLNIYLHDGDESWGFNFFTFNINFRLYSLMSLEFRLPNKTTVKKFTVDDWDFLFLCYPLWNRFESLSVKKLWDPRLTRWEKFQLDLLKTIFG